MTGGAKVPPDDDILGAMTAPPVLLRPVGFWTTRPGDGLPDPSTLASRSWETQRRELIGSYLKNGAVIDEQDDLAVCRICNESCGYRERTDGVWRWPEGLAHYVTRHGVKLPPELVDHMARQGFKPPPVDVPRLQEQLAPTDPRATGLMSKGAVAAVLDEMLTQRPNRTGTGDTRRPGAEMDDATEAIPVQRPWLATVQGVPTKPARIQFDRAIVLGRDRTCDVVLQHQSVSRRHARLVPWRDRLIVQDLGSANGVWHKGQRLTGQVELREGESIALGQATIKVSR